MQTVKEHGKVSCRNPKHKIHITHHHILVTFMRNLIETSLTNESQSTVKYLEPPKLSLTVEELTTLIEVNGGVKTSDSLQRLKEKLLVRHQTNIKEYKMSIDS